MATNPRIEQFVSVFLRTMGASSAPGVPRDMLVSPPDASGWAEWKPVASPLTDHDVSLLETQFGVQLPRLFKDYLTYKCLLMTDFGMMTFPEIRSDSPWREMERYLSLFERNQYLATNRFFPFGTDSRTGNLICFDVRNLGPDEDCPVVSVDLHRVGQPGYTPAVRNSSFSNLLDEIEASLLSFSEVQERKSFGGYLDPRT